MNLWRWLAVLVVVGALVDRDAHEVGVPIVAVAVYCLVVFEQFRLSRGEPAGSPYVRSRWTVVLGSAFLVTAGMFGWLVYHFEDDQSGPGPGIVLMACFGAVVALTLALFRVVRRR